MREETIDRLETLVDKMIVAQQGLPSALDRRSSSGSANSNINVSAGGIGVWACGTACLIMLAVSMVGGMWMSRELNRIDREMADRKDDAERARTYLSAIYAQAPQLQPKEYEDAQ